jgi:hypothetical protein
MQRTLTALATLLALAGALDAAGCASFPSAETADGSSPESGADATGDGTATVETGGGQEGSADAGGDRSNPLPDGSPDSGCKPQSAPNGSMGVFVAQGGGAAGMCGAITAPCGTIAAALAAIAQSGGTKNIVYVAKGTTPYAEQVTLPAGVTIQGGWTYEGGGSWARTCPFDPSQTVIQAPAGADRVVIVSYASGSSTLDTLTIRNPTAAGTGVSLYGVFASSAQATGGALTLENVAVSVAAGGPGGTGGQGVDGGPPPATCAVGVTMQPGSPGAAGNGASVGTYDVNGFHPSTGSTASPGGPGSNGTAGPACGQTGGPGEMQAWQVVTNHYSSDSNCCGTTCSTCPGNATAFCGGQGTPGCGSTGSAGGAGGTGGGASIGVFVWNETVTLDGTSSITTSAGGQGGPGGPGGPVYQGSQGAPGAQSTQVFSTACTPMAGPVCIQSYQPLDGGSPGGPGYSGGIGGQGGGGAGGDSICIVSHQGSSVTTTASCTHGAGGTPGAGGSPTPAPGRSAPTFTAP